jgi:hypothetical protein
VNGAWRALKEIITTSAVEEYHVARREENMINKRRKKKDNECELKELEHLRNVNESRAF